MIVLFDLDGTVLTFSDAPPGPGRTAMDRAVKELFGLDGASTGVRFSGGTDRAIARALLRKAGVRDEAIEGHVEPFLATYLKHLQDELSRRKYRPVGDVATAARTLRERGVCVGIATGNTRPGARLKLASAGLEGSFDLDRGGYGCDAEARADILRAAVGRCAPHAREGASVVVVGDTLHDVAAARAIGAKVVGVAETAAARRELEDAGADVVVDDCGPAIVSAIDSFS